MDSTEGRLPDKPSHLTEPGVKSYERHTGEFRDTTKSGFWGRERIKIRRLSGGVKLAIHHRGGWLFGERGGEEQSDVMKHKNTVFGETSRI